MAGVAAADLDPDLARREIEFVVNDDERGEAELEIAQRLADAAPGFVHVGLRLEQHDARSRPAPSATSPWYRARNGPNRWASAIASTAMKPMLWRLRAYRAPGLPSPAMRSMSGSPSKQPARLASRTGRRARRECALTSWRRAWRARPRLWPEPRPGALRRRGSALRWSARAAPWPAPAAPPERRSQSRRRPAPLRHDRRRNDRHHREIGRGTAERPAAFRQLDRGDMHRIVEIEAREIDR